MRASRRCLRAFAFDVGDLKLGTAVSDPSMRIAQPYKLYKLATFTPGGKEIVWRPADAIAKQIDQDLRRSRLRIKTLVVGLPLALDGAPTLQCKKTVAFVEELLAHSALLPSRCEFHDERFTSVISREQLSSQNVREEKRRRLVDCLAATEILRAYLKRLHFQ